MTSDGSRLDAETDRGLSYQQVIARISSLLEGEDDWVAAMATVTSELHNSFDYFDWTGFYRDVGNRMLVIGPYQGGHGCLRIPYEQGVCGAAAAEKQTQLVPDVEAFPGHIACSATTRSEIVVPVISPKGRLMAVLDVDSDTPAAFDDTDRLYLEQICAELGRQFGDSV